MMVSEGRYIHTKMPVLIWKSLITEQQRISTSGDQSFLISPKGLSHASPPYTRSFDKFPLKLPLARQWKCGGSPNPSLKLMIRTVFEFDARSNLQVRFQREAGSAWIQASLDPEGQAGAEISSNAILSISLEHEPE